MRRRAGHAWGRSAVLAPALLFALSFAAARADDGPTFVFRSIGPATSGGRLGAVAGTDRDPSLYYIGAAGGGIYKTTNGGFDWKPVFDDAAVAPIGALAISATDPRVVWAGAGEANPRNDVSYGDGVYRTTDGGRTWMHAGLDGTSQISSIAIDPRDPQTVVVGALGDPFADSTQRGVYRTTNGGASWTRTLYLGPSTGASDLARDPRDPNVIYAGMWQVRRHAWSIESGGPQDGLFRSRDGGRTWQHLTGHGLPDGVVGRIAVAIARGDHRRIYALIQSKAGLLWRSDDGGKQWRMVSRNTLINQRPFYFSRIFVDPSYRDHAFTDSVYLTETTDGGLTWKQTGSRLHNDHHDMFIARNGARILSGGDGGAELSLDGGRTWVRMNYAALGQAYHVGFDLQDPYNVCTSQQDVGTFCGPSVGSADEGIPSRDWLKIAGGDGTHAWPDPLDPRIIWFSDGGEDNGGSLTVYDTRTRDMFNASPYLRDQNVVPPKDLQYRFNWEAPFAFSPQAGGTAYFGGNVVFQTNDRGKTWRVISPDLTRDIKAHQVITGGPITLEGTGAETSDTILAIAPSPVRAGQLWVGTDDGAVQLTKDGGVHWQNVTMPGVDDAARIECIDPSRTDPATAFVNVDRHFVGDRTAYVFVTHDFGASWRRIDAGLPRGQFVRCIRQDPRNPSVLYAGLEQSLWLSLDGGASWERLQDGLPPASVRDMHVHPIANDLIVATHGRGIWILDDITALQHLADARAAGLYLFTPRAATAYAHHDETFDFLGKGTNPPGDALFTFYRAAATKLATALDVLDAQGNVVRTLSTPPNATGIVRVAWNRTEAPPTPWHTAPGWNRGPDDGAEVVPGPYTVRLRSGAIALERPLVVKADPRTTWTAAEYVQRHAYLKGLYAMLDAVDVALNRLDAVSAGARERLRDPATAALRVQLDGAISRAHALSYRISSHMENDQDDDFLTDLLRERVQAAINATGGSSAPPTAAQLTEKETIETVYRAEMAAVAAFLSGDVAELNRALRARGLAPVDPERVLPERSASPGRARRGEGE